MVAAYLYCIASRVAHPLSTFSTKTKERGCLAETMPTATTISQYTLTNWGPLTTAFTADAACATQPANTVVALREALGVGYNVECGVPTVGASCHPSGSKIDAYASLASNKIDRFIMGYFSPGLVCPFGWETVGLVAKASDGSVASTWGIFERPAASSSTSTSGGSRILHNPAVNAFTAAIDPGETGIACCPRLVRSPCLVGTKGACG